MPTEKDVQYYSELVRENVADKTISDNILVRSYYNWHISKIFFFWNKMIISTTLDDYCNQEDLLDSYEILWHEVMIWDLLDWIEKKINNSYYYAVDMAEEWRDRWSVEPTKRWEIIFSILNLRKNKRLPYSALPDDTKIELGKIVEEVLLSNEK